jgi:hypothetical protein
MNGKTLAIFLSGCIALQPAAHAQIGTVTFGAFLLSALNKVQDDIRQAEESGKSVEIEGGIQVQNAITQAQIAYSDSLNDTMSSLDKERQKVVADINTMIQEFEAGTNEQINQALTQAQLIANELPISKRFPQLSVFSPNYVLPTGDYHVVFKGNFPYGFTNSTVPLLKFNGKTYKAATYSNVEIAFEIPAGDIAPSPPGTISFKNAVIRLPWKDCRIMGFVCSDKIAEYGFEIAELPSSPPEIHIIHQIISSTTETQTRSSQVWYSDSSQDDIEETHCLTLSGTDQQAGWHLVPNSAHFVLNRHIEGTQNSDWFDEGPQDQSDISACWKVKTLHKSWGSSGKVQWSISAQVTKTDTSTTDKDEVVPLKWASSEIYSYPAGTWKIKYANFSGGTTEITATDLTSSLVKVVAPGSSVSIQTYGD